MKKFIVFIITAIILAVATSFTAKAQWSYKFFKADELIGNEEYYSNLYKDANGNGFICWDNENSIKIVLGSGIFNYESKYISGDILEYLSMTIGLYENGTLKEKLVETFFVEDDNASVAYIAGTTAQKILKHIKNVGDVRFIASRHGKSDMDMRVPKNQQLKYKSPNSEEFDTEVAISDFDIEEYEKLYEEFEEEPIPFQLVETKPTFNDGDANEFQKWVSDNLTYPQSAKERKIQGRVTLQFNVDKEGNVKNVRVLRSVSKELDSEAVRVVSSSPKWKPAEQAGRKVNCTYTFPVIFQLK